MTLSFQVEPLLLRVTNKPQIKKNKVAFIAVEIEPETWINLDSRTHYIVEVEDKDFKAYVSELAVGVVCQLVPKTILQKKIVHNGVKFNRKIITTTNFTLVRSEGSLIIKLLSSGKFRGVGELKAKRLWQRFGDELYDILDTSRIDLLTSDFEGRLTPKTANNLIKSWNSYLNTDALKFCSQLKLTVSQTTRIIQFYKENTKKKLQEDPYRLLAFNIPFKFADDMAIEQFGISPNDPKRISAAVEEVLYHKLDSGSVVVDKDEIYQQLTKLLSDDDLAKIPFNDNFDSNNCYTKLSGGKFQSNGSYIMESYLAEEFSRLIALKPKVTLLKTQINTAIEKYQSGKELRLTKQQKSAVYGALENSFCLLNGGAGVGKTTVLDCVYSVFDECGIVPVQVALAAKAAKRMTEATGRPASTIARFIWRNEKLNVQPEKIALVIDESSMVDLFSMYQLVKALPKGARIVMVGDSGQLSPVGYGLVFHELLKINKIPQVILTEVKRQASSSSIPLISALIAKGKKPEFNTEDVIFNKVNVKKQVLKNILQEFEKDKENTQIICATNNMVKEINTCCAKLNQFRKLLTYSEYFDSFEFTGFKLGDRVICNQNLYDIDVMNGTLGKITECYNTKETKEVIIDNTKQIKVFSFGKVQWNDGSITEISEELLNGLSLAYAITIHKSQGSQYPKVVIPTIQAPNMDRSMLYTAITRAEEKVVLIGSDKTINESLNIVHAEHRKADLASKLERLLQ
jgi:exodeoxyribonuclease V alpha subunit